MVHFSKLKLYGFKSFVDKTELEIGPGLNGIVGPNGCGKSNLVEAMRWVMGEKSAKNMRGGGMEDVIFAGTAKRPARNAAEVAIIIDNQDGLAPAPFESASEIEITRRIEKDKGSQYRVNGKAVRARDVNLLFADTMTGANSPALVSQGRITEIITAKPQDRRRILEESAGISGLHSRRHEAELRLRAAEQNLLRLDDVLRDMRNRLSSLKRQSRQAEKYKELNAAIRQYDMALVWLEWLDIRQKIKSGRDDFATHNDAVQKLLHTSKDLVSQIENHEKSLPDLRKKDTEYRAVLQNFRVSMERLEQDIQNKLKNLSDAEQAKEQLDNDTTFAKTQYDEILEEIDRVNDSLKTAKEDSIALPDQIIIFETAYNTVKSEHGVLLAKRQEMQTAIAVAEESRAQTTTRLSDVDNRIASLESSIANTEQNFVQINERKADITNDPAFKTDFEKMKSDLDKLEKTISQYRSSYDNDQAALTLMQNDLNELRSEIRGLESEKKALETLVESTNTSNESDNNLLNSLKVKEGYEKAVSAAFDHWLTDAGTAEGSAVYWSADNSQAKEFAPLTNCTMMNEIMDAPASLNTFTSSVGIVNDRSEGDALVKTLSVGQMIVSKDGDIWRWDGLRVDAARYQSTDTAALILEQTNRIKSLTESIADLGQTLLGKEAHIAEATTKLETLKSKINETSQKYDSDKQTYFNAERAKARFDDQMQSLTREESNLKAQLEQFKTDRADLKTQQEKLQSEMKKTDVESLATQKIQLEELTVQIDALQNDLDTKQSDLVSVKNKRDMLATRTESLQETLSKQEKERDKLSERLEDLTERQDAIDQKIKDYKAGQNQDAADSERESLLSKIAVQDQTVRDNAIKLEIAEKTYRELQNSLREAEANAANAREKRAMVQANIANYEDDLKRSENIISEKFSMNPQSLEEQVMSLFNEDVPHQPVLQAERDKALQQREAIGPVNLRAAIESTETEAQLAEMEAEQNDLIKAIEQLRTGINKLNREARERLNIAFTRVDQFFQILFTDLFGGGKAYLQMIESDDPLESGLEIFAQPPGKSLQTLSLLSGGEQTLTATALIFAMFQTNPSPICVLDEIDAPLDDANVDRVCGLMEKIARETDTRFIVITHHRMTMARMDRLYGVTMGERGVSQLVSVDLAAIQEELDLAETA